MDALGPDLQTIYNLVHDLKRFPLPQSEHQAERSRSEAEEPCVQVSPPRLLLPRGSQGGGRCEGPALCRCRAGRWDGAAIAAVSGDF